MKCFRLPALLIAVALPAVALTGCNSAPAIRADLSPTTDSTTRSTEQDYNDYARIIDHNTRGAWDDASRILLLDKPSRLSPWVIP
ncbi:MAG: hypothetical protein AAGE65_12995 [Planctomycetota bacterium]